MNDFIEIRGARENNLRNISLRIPKHKLTDTTEAIGSTSAFKISNGQECLIWSKTGGLETILPVYIGHVMEEISRSGRVIGRRIVGLKEISRSGRVTGRRIVGLKEISRSGRVIRRRIVGLKEISRPLAVQAPKKTAEVYGMISMLWTSAVFY